MVENELKISLCEVWSQEDFKKAVKVMGYAAGSIDENASPEMLKVYEDLAFCCEAYIRFFNSKVKKPL